MHLSLWIDGERGGAGVGLRGAGDDGGRAKRLHPRVDGEHVTSIVPRWRAPKPPGCGVTYTGDPA